PQIDSPFVRGVMFRPMTQRAHRLLVLGLFLS
ncbi:MAG: hypothetical protein RIQ75_1412, partial [Pseudomonadota bacterium]